MKRNKFKRALHHLNKKNVVESAPTNSTLGVFSVIPSGVGPVGWTDRTFTKDASGNPLPKFEVADFTVGDNPETSEEALDTSGLFEADGVTVKTLTPPGDNSYILGPFSSMWYAWGNFTTLGYIEQGTRKMVNLGTITGKLSDWNGSSINSYGQLTLEQALWFRDVPKFGGIDNDPANHNYRARYPGPPSNTPDAYGRYLCVIAASREAGGTETRPGAPDNPTQPGEMSSDDNFSAIMSKLKKSIEAFGDFAADPLGAIADFFGDNLTPPAAEYATNIAKSVLFNKPITVKQEDVPKGDIDKLINGFNDNATWIPISVSTNGQKTPYADENFYVDKKGNVNSNIGPNGEKAYYKKDTTGPVDGDVGVAGYGNPLAAAGQAQVQVVTGGDGKDYILYTDHAYHNLESDDPGEVPDSVKAGLSWLIHNVTGKGDSTKPNTGGMSGYPPNIKGDVKTEIRIDLDDPRISDEFRDRVKREKYYKELGITESFKSKGRLLKESKKRILREIKKPTILPEAKKKYKVKPKVLGHPSNKTLSNQMKDTTPNVAFKKEIPVWSMDQKMRNARESQRKKNEVFEYLGSSGDHWNYMTKTIKEHNKKIINLNYGGKKKKVTRKEQVDKDILVFMEDDLGNKSSVLQSKINEMQAEAGDKEMFAKYYEMNPQKKSLFKEVVKRGVFDYKGKPSKKGYPDKEPAQLDPKTGMHPEYGKKYKHDKLDPQSAESMPMQGNPEIDANIAKNLNPESKKRKTKVLNQPNG